jgi:hypothetical protein
MLPALKSLNKKALLPYGKKEPRGSAYPQHHDSAYGEAALKVLKAAEHDLNESKEMLRKAASRKWDTTVIEEELAENVEAFQKAHFIYEDLGPHAFHFHDTDTFPIYALRMEQTKKDAETMHLAKIKKEKKDREEREFAAQLAALSTEETKWVGSSVCAALATPLRCFCYCAGELAARVFRLLVQAWRRRPRLIRG